MAKLTKHGKFDKKHSHASQQYLRRQAADTFAMAARKQGYRSRAAFKLTWIDDKYKILKPGKDVVDLGAAPGSWTEVVLERLKGSGKVIAIDKIEMEDIPEATVLAGDITSEKVFNDLLALCPAGVDVVLSDLAPETSGNSSTDHIRSMMLCDIALEFAKRTLKPGGSFVCKLFQGGEEKLLMENLRKLFTKAAFEKPEASRKDSKEIFVVAVGFKA